MADRIKLKPADSLYSDLARGELALDEAGRTLHVDLGTSEGPIPLPLDVLGVPDAADASGVLVFEEAGPEYRPPVAGGGGRPFDNGPWRVPGLVLLSYGQQVVTAALSGVIEVSFPLQVLWLRVEPEVADVNFTMGIRTLDGEVLDSVDLNGLDGPFVEAFSALLLDVGRYEVFVTCEAPLTFATVTGYRRNIDTPETVAVFMRTA